MTDFKFLKSAKSKEDYPKGRRPEVVIVGRSNSGKSSLINAMAGSRVAKVSQKPGKTQLLQFFVVGEQYHLVDTPGYGFAARSADDRDSWAEMIEGYLRYRKNLTGLLLLMDCRREWSEDEQLLISWWADRGLPLALILTKSDKISRSQLSLKVKEIQKFIGEGSIIPVSAFKGQGVSALKQFIFEKWVKSHPGLC